VYRLNIVFLALSAIVEVAAMLVVFAILEHRVKET
jgi:hypothetical protein